MSVLWYNFSLRGISHSERNMPCQDTSMVFSKGIWKLAVAADGVGSCKHSDEASSIVANAFCEVVNACFPYQGDDNFIALLRIAMHGAANSLESYVEKQNGDMSEYQTTLVAALYDGNTIYYCNAGDSGVVALDEDGEYHLLSKQMQNEYGEVFTVSGRDFQVGKASFNAAALICMTDGLLEWIVPKSLRKHSSCVHVLRAGILVKPDLFSNKIEWDENRMSEYGERVKDVIMRISNSYSNGKESLDEYGSLSEGNLKDDLTAVVLVNSSSFLTPDDIKWNPPAVQSPEEFYLEQCEMFSQLYPSDAENRFKSFVEEKNDGWNEEQVREFVDSIWNKSRNNNMQFTTKSISNKKNNLNIFSESEQKFTEKKNGLFGALRGYKTKDKND